MLADKNQPKTSISELGTYDLIHHLSNFFSIKNSNTTKSIGDDAAVLDCKNQSVSNTELMVEGVDFDLSYMPLKHLGYKAVVNSISNICAMNVAPSHINVAIAVSNRFPIEALEELYMGIELACKTYQIEVVGNKVTSSQKGLIISITSFGNEEKEHIIYRDTAKPNQLLVISGDIGAAYMGLQVLEREKQVFLVNPANQPDLDPYTYLIERQLKPEARTDIKTLLAALEIHPESMIDITDGLSSDLLQICKSSKIGCALYEDKLPLDPQFISVCEEFNIDSTTIAINGGEDYELLFTIKMEDFDKIKGNPNLTIIGHTLAEEAGTHLITRSNTQIPIKARGWK